MTTTKKETMTTEHILYILMRNDLASLNAGKACAHAAHASNQFEHHFAYDRTDYNLHGTKSDLLDSYSSWTSGHPTNKFGTTITLGVTGIQLAMIVSALHENKHIAGIVFDPTYPIRDGSVTHLIPLETCGYAFGDRNTLSPFLSNLDLMP